MFFTFHLYVEDNDPRLAVGYYVDYKSPVSACFWLVPTS